MNCPHQYPLRLSGFPVGASQNQFGASPTPFRVPDMAVWALEAAFAASESQIRVVQSGFRTPEFYFTTLKSDFAMPGCPCPTPKTGLRPPETGICARFTLFLNR
jgi:hypothetical protein